MTILEKNNQKQSLTQLQEKITVVLKQGAVGQPEISSLLKQLSTQLEMFDEDYHQLMFERDGLRELAEIGESLTSTLDSNAILEKVLDSIIELAQAERCFLMLLDPDGSTHVQIGRNWRQETLSDQEKAISSTIVHEAIKKREAVLTTDAESDPRFDGTESVVSYKLRSVMCVPLIHHQELLGVIYADHRLRSEQFSKSKLELLSKFANQAAIALHNASLYENLQQTHLDLQSTHSELEEAYDTTLEGWAKVLELRDPTTDGHTKRVLELSEKLAKFLGVSGEDLINIRRGAVLHDIGKMAIPDDVLCKPGALTSDEIEIMRIHPLLAMEMLSGIKFLKDALAIPLHHHERWDGTGYPHGLAGEQIPLAARVFAVVDVWDALTSERPYRKALTPQETLAHIQKGAGKHFDPEVVAAFIQMMEIYR